MSELPKISVVMTSYNYADYIRPAIESVWKQRYENLELVIVDDASTDNSKDVLQRALRDSPIPMRVEFNDVNQGPNKTHNRAVSLATGEYLAFLGSDDLFEPDIFHRQVEAFCKDKSVKLVYANGWSFDHKKIKRLHDENTVRLLQSSPSDVLLYLYTHTSPLFLQTLLINKDFFESCGGNDENVLADDWVLNIRFFESLVKSGGKFAYVDEDVALYRVHDRNLHKVSDRQLRLREQVVAVYTPKVLQRTAKGNIYLKAADIALISGDIKEAVRLHAKSQLNCFRLRVLVGFIRRVFVNVVSV